MEARNESRFRIPSLKNPWWSPIGANLASAISYGTAFSFPVILQAIRKDFGVTSLGQSAWVVSICFSVVKIQSPLNPKAAFLNMIAGILADSFPFTILSSCGLLLCIFSLVLTSFTNSIWQLFITHGFFFGIAISFTFMPTLVTVGKLFRNKNASTGNGIASSGSGVGNLIFPLIANRLIDKLAWRNTLRIWILFPALYWFVLMVLPRPPADALPEVEEKVDSSTLRKRKLMGLWSSFKSLLQLKEFRLLFLAQALGYFGFYVPYAHIVSFSVQVGISSTIASVLLAVMGASGILGRIGMGLLADTRVGKLNSFRMAFFGMALSVYLWPLCKNIYSLSVFVVCYGFCGGAFIGLVPSISLERFGVRLVGNATGTLYASGAIGYLVGGPIVGVLYDHLGSYVPGAILSASVITLGFITLFFVKTYPTKEEPKVEVVSEAVNLEETIKEEV